MEKGVCVGTDGLWPHASGCSWAGSGWGGPSPDKPKPAGLGCLMGGSWLLRSTRPFTGRHTVCEILVSYYF